jgi:hypothetical protein
LVKIVDTLLTRICGEFPGGFSEKRAGKASGKSSLKFKFKEIKNKRKSPQISLKIHKN